MKKKNYLVLVLSLLLILVGGFIHGKCVYATTVGNTLVQPEEGWKRCDDRDDRFKYTNFEQFEDKESYMLGFHQTCDQDNDKLNFVISGERIRIIGIKHQQYPTQVEVKANNKVIGSFDSSSTVARRQVVLFDYNFGKKGLYNIEISTKVHENYHYGYVVDAIDIDEDGELLPNDQYLFLDQSKKDMKVGSSEVFKATVIDNYTEVDKNIKWSSNDRSIATVDENGKVTAVGIGKATITATIEGTGISDSCEVTVSEDSKSSIRLNKSSLNLFKNNTETLTATTTNKDDKIVWKSSDESIATVDNNGNVIAVGLGKATITAMIEGTELSDSCEVTVTEPSDSDIPSIDDDKKNGSLYIEMIDGNIKHATNIDIDDFLRWYKNRDADKTESPIYKITNAKGNIEYLVHDKIVAFEVKE